VSIDIEDGWPVIMLVLPAIVLVIVHRWMAELITGDDTQSTQIYLFPLGQVIPIGPTPTDRARYSDNRKRGKGREGPTKLSSHVV
jgi:hypothetical protein